MLIAKGQGASPGEAQGPLALTAESALDLASRGTPPIFVRNEMEAADVPAIRVAAGIVIARGGITADGAVAARALGKPCIVGCTGAAIRDVEIKVGKTVVAPGAIVKMNAATGELHAD
ncbi:MAG TPA: PEP-utilizing enzyme [Polyangiaceae bacterium]